MSHTIVPDLPPLPLSANRLGTFASGWVRQRGVCAVASSAIPKTRDQYPDDIFKDTRMPLGEHIEGVRSRMINAPKWLGFFLVIGFVLDGIGSGVGKRQHRRRQAHVKDHHGTGRNANARLLLPPHEEDRGKKIKELRMSESGEVAAIREKLKNNNNDLTSLTAEERQTLLGAPQQMHFFVDPQQLKPAFGDPKPDAPERLSMTVEVYPAEITILNDTGTALIESKQYLTTLSARSVHGVLQGVAVVRSSAGQPVHPVSVLGVRRGRVVSARKAVHLPPSARVWGCSLRAWCCISSWYCPVR